jgi:predicted AAA+ superfamily ATPase
LAEVRAALERSPIAAVLGPRQCGKTTLARDLAGSDAHFFDLESSADRLALSAAPEEVLGRLRGLVVLDEAQMLPTLFPVLRILADRVESPARFLILGSAAPELIRGASETLAGRVAFVHLSGFTWAETGAEQADVLWQRGGFPRSFLAADDATSYAWRQDFIDTFLSRDAAALGLQSPPEQLRRFWTMLAHLHGGVLNVSELARAISVDHKTAGRYVDVLAGAYLVRRLQPWFENAGKRVVKAPKILLRDTGLLHALLGLRNRSEVLSHPRFGLSWEGFAAEQIIQQLRAERDAWFWATHGGAELDLLITRGGRRLGFEFKHADAPSTTRSMRVALADLRLDQLWVVYPGRRSFPLDDRIEAVGMNDLPQRLAAWDQRPS